MEIIEDNDEKEISGKRKTGTHCTVEKSGMTMQAYAKSMDLNYGTFRHWICISESREEVHSTLVQIQTPTPEVNEVQQGNTVTIRKGGMEMSVPMLRRSQCHLYYTTDYRL